MSNQTKSANQVQLVSTLAGLNILLTDTSGNLKRFNTSELFVREPMTDLNEPPSFQLSASRLYQGVLNAPEGVSTLGTIAITLTWDRNAAYQILLSTFAVYFRAKSVTWKSWERLHMYSGA